MGETPANRASSRSHAVFTLTISSEREEEISQGDENTSDRESDDGQDGDGDKSQTRVVVSECELTLVDLAGCERMYKNDQYG